MARRRMLKSRFYGLVGAGAFAIGAGVLFGIIMLSGGGRSSEGIPDPDAPAPPDIRDALPSHATQGAMAGKDLLVQMMDKEDPTRQAGELRAAVIDPLPLAGHYDVDKPQIWMFLKSGKTLYVRADEGQLVMPSRRQEPESGVLRGAVEIRIYDVHGVGGEAELGPPSIVARTPFLTFDTTVPELESPQPFTVDGRGIHFEGKTLRVLASQTRERLELVEVLGGGTLTYTPQKDEQSRRADRTTGERRTLASNSTWAGATRTGRIVNASFQPESDGPQAAEPQVPNIVNYLATFADEVTVTQAERILEGDRLDVWARLVDGRLPEDAIGGSSKDEPGPGAGPETVPEKPAQDNTPRPRTPPSEPIAEKPESVTLAWTGPMVARPLSNEPRELEMNHVHLRVTADKRGEVTMEDASTGAAGRCAVLDYGATTQDLALSSPGTGEAMLWVPDQGRIASARIEQNLGSGIGHVPGPGRIEGAAESGADDEELPMARWNDSATFIFEIENERMSDRIREAILMGDVGTSSQGSSMKGDLLHAYFTDGESGSPALTRVRGEGDVKTHDAKGNALSADTLDVAFKSGGDEPEPSVATAIGSVKVTSSAGDVVTAAFIEAELGRDEAGELGARTVRAEEWVEVSTAAGQRAVTPVLLADVPEQIIDLVGPGSLASQLKDGLLTEVNGEAIRLYGKSRAIHVQAAGTFRHGPAGQGPEPLSGSEAVPPRTIEAKWTESMRFDDEAGTLEARGEVHAESIIPGVERQELDADVINARLMPASEHERLVRDAKRDGLPAPGRSLVFAQASVDATVAGGGTESRVQSVHYAPATADVVSEGQTPADTRIERLFQAQGDTITADNQAGFIEIPGPGRMVMADLREKSGSSDGAAAGSATSAGSARGRSMFEWAGSMRYEREPGVVRLTGRAAMVQRRLEDGGVLNVNADVLEARVRQTPADTGTASAPAEDKFELTGVTARGHVVVTERVGVPLVLKREVLAELLDYDTVRGVAEASAPSGGLVTLLETSRGTPVNAKSIFWNLVEDRVEIRGMSSVTAPR